MSFQNLLIFYPERVLWIGISLLSSLFLVGIPLSIFPRGNDSLVVDLKNGVKGEKRNGALSFSLGLESKGYPFPSLNIENEMTFSFDPPRPDGVLHRPQLLVRLKRSGQSRRVSIPCRIDLQYGEGEKLYFSDKETSFWIELSPSASGQIETKVF